MQTITQPMERSKALDEFTDDFNDWLQLIRAEYAEMPGLHLSTRQAQRLWGLDRGRCQALLDALETARFLRRTATEAYVRADIGSC